MVWQTLAITDKKECKFHLGRNFRSFLFTVLFSIEKSTWNIDIILPKEFERIGWNHTWKHRANCRILKELGLVFVLCCILLETSKFPPYRLNFLWRPGTLVPKSTHTDFSIVSIPGDWNHVTWTFWRNLMQKRSK